MSAFEHTDTFARFLCIYANLMHDEWEIIQTQKLIWLHLPKEWVNERVKPTYSNSRSSAYRHSQSHFSFCSAQTDRLSLSVVGKMCFIYIVWIWKLFLCVTIFNLMLLYFNEMNALIASSLAKHFECFHWPGEVRVLRHANGREGFCEKHLSTVVSP